MIINRVWEMPNKNTFSIPSVKAVIDRYIHGESIDPFANSNRIAHITNDLDPQFSTTYNMDALDFLRLFDDSTIDTVLYDPPYSPRQVSECYRRLDRTVDMSTTSASYWSKQKKEIGRIVKIGGVCITCGWNSNGIGKCNGFEIEEILMVAHGGWHNDTIITVERKVR